MKCAVHAEVDATGFCRNCGKALCAECTREVRGILYCEACLADMVSKPQPPPVATGSGSPGLALGLGFIPGLGAVYNGEYTKALIHVAIFIGIIGALNSDLGDAMDAMLGVTLAAFICFMAIDAYRVAQARLHGKAAPAAPLNLHGNLPIGPLILIGMGVLFLLHRFIPIGQYIKEFWPVILIVLGVLLLYKRTSRS